MYYVARDLFWGEHFYYQAELICCQGYVAHQSSPLFLKSMHALSYQQGMNSFYESADAFKGWVDEVHKFSTKWAHLNCEDHRKGHILGKRILSAYLDPKEE